MPPVLNSTKDPSPTHASDFTYYQQESVALEEVWLDRHFWTCRPSYDRTSTETCSKDLPLLSPEQITAIPLLGCKLNCTLTALASFLPVKPCTKKPSLSSLLCCVWISRRTPVQWTLPTEIPCSYLIHVEWISVAFDQSSNFDVGAFPSLKRLHTDYFSCYWIGPSRQGTEQF